MNNKGDIHEKRILAAVLCAALVLAFIPATALASGTYNGLIVGGGTEGTDYSFNSATNKLTILTGTSLVLSGTTYYTHVVVQPGITANIVLNGVKIGGASYGCPFDMAGATVNLTLDGSSTLSAPPLTAGIHCPPGATLAISDWGGGSLSVQGSADSAGIGGNGDYSTHEDCGRVIINSGVVFAKGGGGAGIGGSLNGNGGDITINGGTVEATGGGGSAGIGGGYGGSGGKITVNGGMVTANGGSDHSNGTLGAGIGSGGYGGSGGTITVNGGTVTATGGSDDTNGVGGAGIGGGCSAYGGTITVNGGMVTAVGGNGSAGIGGGAGGGGGNIAIKDGSVEATGGQGIVAYGSGAGIGGGAGGGGGQINISGGTVTANGGFSYISAGYGAGIGGGSKANGSGLVTLSGGAVFAASRGLSAQDIGDGTSGIGAALDVSGTTAVFLKNDSSVLPNTTSHAHVGVTGHSAGDDVYGVPVPWDGNFGAWIRQYTLTYSTSGGSETPPASVTQFTGTTATVEAPGTYARTGYTQGIGWNTAADGGGTDINAGGSYTFNADATLYANWTPHTFSVAYDASGGSGTTAASAHTYDVAKALTANGFTRTGYSFDGWATSQTGFAQYTDRQSVKNLSATDGDTVNLYAKWTPHTYTVQYHANGGSGTTAASVHTYDVSKALTTNAFTWTGYTFEGWATTQTGSLQYTDEQSVFNLTAEDGATINLYANWAPHSYTVAYDANGGSGTTTSSVHTYDTAKALTANAFTRHGYTFIGWSANQTGPVQYTDKQSVKNLKAEDGATVTLYAVWAQAVKISISAGSQMLYTGGRTTLTPQVPGGTWSYDRSMVSLKDNGDGIYTVTALKSGIASLHYTVGWAEADIALTIRERTMPQTGQDITPVYVLLILAGCATSAALICKKKKANC